MPKAQYKAGRVPTANPFVLDGLTVSGHKTLRPTPDILDALEKDYPIEASVADLVDNSIDAGAEDVLIRFSRTGERLSSLLIVDNGTGMDASAIDLAMQFAGRRRYRPSDLGMFGVGLKTASLSQADTVTVVSRRSGEGAVGRQWTKAGIKERDWSLNIISQESSEFLLERTWGTLGPIRSGTVVLWSKVYDFDRLREGVEAYLDRAIGRIQLHLGLKLHRFISRRQVRVSIDVEDGLTNESGPPFQVQELDPFPNRDQNGVRGYPKWFVASLPDGKKLRMRAYIWRKKSSADGYKLGGGRVAEHQGLYFYRHDRMIQDGGWCGLFGTSEPHLSLARVEIDLPESLKGYLKVRSNKAGIDAPASFVDSVLHATARDGTGFRDYLSRAEEAYRQRAEQKAKPMLRPGDGVPGEVISALERDSVRFSRGSCSIEWRKLPTSDLFDIDQDERAIVLNVRYRKMLLRGQHGGSTDVPLLRTLLYFLLESVLAGDRISRVERLRLDAIQGATRAALKLEKAWAAEQ